MRRTRLLLLAVLPLFAVHLLAQAPQSQFGNIEAPNAITLRIVKVMDISKEAVTSVEDSFQNGEAIRVTTTQYAPGTMIVAETITAPKIRYSLSCKTRFKEVQTDRGLDRKVERSVFGEFSPQGLIGSDGYSVAPYYWDEYQPSSMLPKNEPPSLYNGYSVPAVAGGDWVFQHAYTGLESVCSNTKFHAGDVVDFYSVDNLVWLRISNSRGEQLVHGKAWEAVYSEIGDKGFITWGSRLDTSVCVSQACVKDETNVHRWEKAYAIDSDELVEP